MKKVFWPLALLLLASPALSQETTEEKLAKLEKKLDAAITRLDRYTETNRSKVNAVEDKLNYIGIKYGDKPSTIFNENGDQAKGKRTIVIGPDNRLETGQLGSGITVVGNRNRVAAISSAGAPFGLDNMVATNVFGEGNVVARGAVFGAKNKAAWYPGAVNPHYIFGNSNETRGTNAIAIGDANKAYGIYSIAQGYMARAEGDYAVGVGMLAKALANESIALGNHSEAKINNSVALGSDSKASRAPGQLGYFVDATGAKATTPEQAMTLLGYNTKNLQNYLKFRESMVDAAEWKAYQDAEVARDQLGQKKAEAISKWVEKGADTKAPEYAQIRQLTDQWKQAQADFSAKQSAWNKKVGATGQRDLYSSIRRKDEFHWAQWRGVRSTVGDVAVGNPDRGVLRQITGVAPGSQKTDAVNVEQLQNVVAMAKAGSLAHLSVVSTSPALSATYAFDPKATGQTVTLALDGSKIDLTKNPALANLGKDTVSAADLNKFKKEVNDTFTLLTESDTDFDRRLVELKTSTSQINTTLRDLRAKDADHDAQLKHLKKTVTKQGTTLQTQGEQIGSLQKDTAALHKETANLQKGVTALQRDTTALEKRVTALEEGAPAIDTQELEDRLAHRMAQGNAATIALGALQTLDYDELRPTNITFGFGALDGQTALAVGLSHYTDRDHLFTLGTTVGGKNFGLRAGIAFRLGKDQGEKALTTDSDLARRVAQLEAELAKLKEAK